MQRNISIVYDALFRQMYAKLFFYAKGLVGSEDDAQDVVEDVFTDLWQRRDDIEFGDQISSFLYRAVYTRSINLLKRRKISSGYIQQLDDISCKLLETLQSNLKNPVHTLENNELGSMLNDAIDELPIRCREVFRMSYLQGLHNNDIAELTGTSVRTVEAHMYRALKYLRQKLSNISNFYSD
ncbi:RNA polymerase sigma-70 factor [Hoylesella timonensis]